MQLSKENKEAIEAIAKKEDINYGELKLIIQSGKVIDVVTTKRTRII